MPTEWRVVLVLKNAISESIETNLDSEEKAREYAALEKADYPHYQVLIESREVSPWTVIKEES
jgi:phosphoribosyl-ATP pyrophosphohydrolase